jgi:hypothetical protein
MFDKKKIAHLLQQYDQLVASQGYWFWYNQVQANQIINLLTVVIWWELFISGKKNVNSIMDLS